MSEEYISLNDGEKIQAGDEYNDQNEWRTVPYFLVGDSVKKSSVQWRRHVKKEEVVIGTPKRKTSFSKLFEFLFGK